MQVFYFQNPCVRRLDVKQKKKGPGGFRQCETRMARLRPRDTKERWVSARSTAALLILGRPGYFVLVSKTKCWKTGLKWRKIWVMSFVFGSGP